MARKSFWLTLPFLMILSGCGTRFFTDRASNPVSEDYISQTAFSPDYGTLSTNAGRRTILVQFRTDPGVRPRVCAEPPPDALEAYANALTAAARASASAPAAERAGASFGGEFSRSLSTSTAPMLYRTQGLQLMRDMQFTLCVMFLNKVINEQTYLERLMQTLPVAAKLIESEIPAIEKASERQATVVSAPVINLPGVTTPEAAKQVVAGAAAK